MNRNQREYTHTCTHLGCRKQSSLKMTHYPYWKCERHNDRETNLTTQNPTSRAVWELHQHWSKDRGYGPAEPEGTYWGPAGADQGSTSTVRGPGFIAKGSSFPPGTRLIVTTQIVLPEDAPTLEGSLEVLACEWSEKEARMGPAWQVPLRRTFDSATRLISEDAPDPSAVARVIGILRYYVEEYAQDAERQRAAALVADVLEARIEEV